MPDDQASKVVDQSLTVEMDIDSANNGAPRHPDTESGRGACHWPGSTGVVPHLWIWNCNCASGPRATFPVLALAQFIH